MKIQQMKKILVPIILILCNTVITFAQSESAEATSLEEVKVTAQKKEENAQQIPIGISVISGKQVAFQQIWTTKDITALVPNLYAASPGDYRNVTSLRGIATTSYDQAVATYVDGVNQFSLDTYIAQLNDIERIEVLRGPQGTLYGRNAMGGVINIITRQPTNTPNGFASVDFGGYGLQRYSLGLRTPIVRDKVFIGLSGNFNRTDGFYSNEFNQSAFDRQHSVSGNYFIKYVATPRLSYTLNIKHNQNRNNGAFPLAGNAEGALSNPFEVNQDAQTQLIDNIFNGSFSVNYAGKSVAVVSQSAYQSNYRYYDSPIDGDFSPIDGISIVNNYGNDWNNMKVLSQELRMNSVPSGSAFNWTTGIYGFYQHSPVKQGIYFGDDANLIDEGAYPNSTSLSINKGNNTGLAVFGDLSYAISDRLKAGAGLRYDYEHKRLSVRGEFLMPEQNPMVYPADTSASSNFSAFTPKLSLDYSLTNTNRLYTIYSTGFRAGGLTQLAADPSQPPLFSYDPEYSHNFEIGSKNTFFDNHLRVNLAVYYIRINGVQVPSLVLPDAITVTRNAGKLDSRGVELEIATTPVKSLELSYAFGYTRAGYGDLNLSANSSEIKLIGSRQVFTPDVTSMLALRYNYALNKDIHLIAGGEWRYIGDQFFDLSNNIGQKAYHLSNARLGVGVKKIECYIWGNNIGNTTYIDYAYDFGAVHLGNPRVFGVSVSTKF
jgi:iron complex outermembrane receptor protein